MLGAFTAALLVLAVMPAAQAADGPYSIGGTPTTIPDDGTTELLDAYGNVKELGPLNSNTTKIGVIHSDVVPTLGLTNPNGQVDLRRAWLDTERDTSTGHDWLYFAWERDANSGSGFIAYEFMQDPVPTGCAYDTATDAQLIANCNPWANRRAGDFMILWDQQGNSLDLWLRTWTGTAPNLTLGAPEKLNADVSQAAYSSDGFRGEAAVDLTATIFGGSTACKSFANTIPSTVTGNSDTADYKDTILKTAPPITNCGSTIVTTPKVVTDTSKDPDTTANVPAGGASIGTGVLAVADSALVDIQGGTATPAGSVAFYLCKVDDPGVCDTGGTNVGSTNLSGTAYPVTVQSPTAYVTSAGRYCWRGVFSGDSPNGIPGKTDSSANECFTVNPVTPDLTTSAGDDVLVGQAVTDTATLGAVTPSATQPASSVINLTGTAGAAAGGKIAFTLLGPDGDSPNCSTSPTSALGTLNAAIADTTTTSIQVNETVAPPAVPFTIKIDSELMSVTARSGASNPRTYTVVRGFGGSTKALHNANAAVSLYPYFEVSVNGDNTYGPVSFVVASPGTYHWKATYTPATGDLNNLGSTHNGSCDDTNEDVVVSTVPTSIATDQWIYPNDDATISTDAGGDLVGSVQFRLYDTQANCKANLTGQGSGLLYQESVSITDDNDDNSGADTETVSTSNQGNTGTKVSSDATVYWRVLFDSSNLAQEDRLSDCAENTNVDFTDDAGPGTLPT